MVNKHTLTQLIKNYVKFIIVSFVLLLMYNEVSSFLVQMHHHVKTRSFFIELPLSLLLMSIFYFSRFENRVQKYLLPAVPVIGLYIAFDIYYSYLSRAPRYSDFENFLTIYDFYPFMFVGIILYILFIVSVMTLLFYKAYRVYGRTDVLFLRVLLLSGILVFVQTGLFSKYQEHFFKYIDWSDEKTIKKNGRLSSFLFYSSLEDKSMELLHKQVSNDINISNTLYPNTITNKQNIYMVVLESFINPSYLKHTRYNRNPISEELIPYMIKGDFSKVIAPAYGGMTAQSEFELLTGIKALAKVNSVEFNVLRGEEINGFLHRLKQHGYQNLATIAGDSEFYNSKMAYKSLGFEQVVFLEEMAGFQKDKNDKWIYDGDLYDFHLKAIKERLKYSDKPIFSYILGMYGHMPYERNILKRPDKIVSENLEDETIKRISNQFYYRTKALGKYIKEILAVDSNALILITSDHLPPILNNGIEYQYSKTTNIALLINKGVPIDISEKKQYEIPWLIWDILSNSETKRRYDDHILERLYYKALYEGTI